MLMYLCWMRFNLPVSFLSCLFGLSESTIRAILKDTRNQVYLQVKKSNELRLPSFEQRTRDGYWVHHPLTGESHRATVIIDGKEQPCLGSGDIITQMDILSGKKKKPTVQNIVAIRLADISFMLKQTKL